MSQFLDHVQTPQDIKSLSVSELEILGEEIRQFVIDSVSHTGGHLAPSLGVVELTLALHYIFDTPRDKLVWDVGHQAYVHKILTGRKERFHTLRQFGGISGFPKISESEHDAFGVGHASTAISAALGMATARDLKKEKSHVVAIVGDGAMTGGMAFEGLNCAGGSKRDLVVVLNDNRMSISANVGALSKYLTSMLTAPIYNKIKSNIWHLVGRFPGRHQIRNTIHRIDTGIKSMVVPGLLFEQLGFRYIGPVNGHDLNQLLRVFSEVKKMRGPILVHSVTTKGKGYKFAEENATKFHGLGSFCRETGSTPPKKLMTFTEVFGKTLVELAEKDEKIVGITAAMAHGTGMVYMSERFKERFFDVGIAEQHAVTFAAGLAREGLKPVVAIYSSFLQRSLDQVLHDIALQKLPVVLALDRSGLVGEDGPTHHGCFDISFLRFIPGLTYMAPKDENELRDMMWTALNRVNGPVVIRYPRGESFGLPLKPDFSEIPMGRGEELRAGKDVALLTIGDQAHPALDIAEKLEAFSISAAVYNARFIKPLDEELILHLASKFKKIITLENNVIQGGFGSAVAEVLADLHKKRARLFRLGLPDRFVAHGKICDLLQDLQLDGPHLVTRIKEIVQS